jgi:hypothetical protein
LALFGLSARPATETVEVGGVGPALSFELLHRIVETAASIAIAVTTMRRGVE